MQTTGISFLLGAYQGAVTNALEKMRRANIAARIWANDYRVWKSSPAEISNRLGWLHAPVETASNAGRIRASLETFTSGAIDDVVLLGMGGSSLSAEVFNAMLGSAPGFPRLQILDTTDPAVIGRTARMLNLEKTLFIVSSKSGKTLEILSLFLYFYNLADAAPGVAANEHFMFITDEGSPMLAQAWQLQLPYVFSNNPNIGGRYAALSLVGMIPAALMGISIETLLQNAMAVAGREKTDFFSGKGDSTGLLLGAALGTLAQYGRDKLTLVFPPAWRPFGDWLEQLIAESLGKEGKGIVPVLNEPPLETQVYGKDRIFVFFEDDPGRWDSRKTELATAGHPLLLLPVGDAYDLGGQMFLWEMATAVAGHLMGVNPFDQPDVEATKEHTSRMIALYRKTRVRPAAAPSLAAAGGDVYGEATGSDPACALQNFLAQAQDGAYVGLQVYLSPSRELDAALARLRAALTRRCKLAVTVGYGPRYLHSTGQLHKGDAGRGLFVQLTGADAADLPIPDDLGEAASTLTFGELKAAQAEADRQALLDQGRKVLRLHWRQDPTAAVNALAESLEP